MPEKSLVYNTMLDFHFVPLATVVYHFVNSDMTEVGNKMKRWSRTEFYSTINLPVSDQQITCTNRIHCTAQVQ